MNRYILFTGYPGQCYMVGIVTTIEAVEKAINASLEHMFAVVLEQGGWRPYVRKGA